MMTSETLAALDPGALERLLDRDLAQFMGRQAGKRAVERADRGAGGADDDDVVFHREFSLQSSAGSRVARLGHCFDSPPNPMLSI